ncbi:hypothetical protein [Nocardioides iriomotensis]|uniref:ATP-grasp domain-containing protein n=1 Tax=Nocardioides iriomotensis TaxID=715784 RepID=A0A4Q5J0H6_9ACTN|nr:hypothetical protein [Nocardioides iriomotensis]RYU11834.1 hypothetical protein ETU37_11225 [Nocardioides iriomotensis]
MDLADEQTRAAWKALLGARLFGGRKVVVGLVPLAASVTWLSMLREAGARRPLVLATGRGAGPVPDDDEADVHVIDRPPAPSMTEELREADVLVHDLPPAAAAALAAYDPDCEAVWLMGWFVVNEPFDGRPVLGGRPASWLALEDKLLAESVWDAVGAAHAPARVVPVDAGALDAAADELDEGAGTVWAGDARDGFNGGGDFTRWVVTPEDRAAALAFFAPRCDRVRVLPFLDGVPCSIHGIVLPDGTAAFRPVELAILRGQDRRFVYGGQGTTWDPPEDDRAQMRDLVRRTGEHLRERVGYRGAFGIDGVLTRDGFRPTELNTRMAGGLSTLARATDDMAFLLLQLAQLADHPPEVTVAELEAWALPAMDGHRVAKALAMSTGRVAAESCELPVRWDGSCLSAAGEDDADGHVLAGPAAVGTFCMLRDLDLAPGERLGPLNAALMAFLDAELGTGFGPVDVPPDLRPG